MPLTPLAQPPLTPKILILAFQNLTNTSLLHDLSVPQISRKFVRNFASYPANNHTAHWRFYDGAPYKSTFYLLTYRQGCKHYSAKPVAEVMNYEWRQRCRWRWWRGWGDVCGTRRVARLIRMRLTRGTTASRLTRRLAVNVSVVNRPDSRRTFAAFQWTHELVNSSLSLDLR